MISESLDPQPPGERQQACVCQDGHRLRLGPKPGRQVVATSDHLLSDILVHEWVVEQAEVELDRQQPAHGLVEPGLWDAARLEQPEQQLDAFLAAELSAPASRMRSIRPDGSRCSTPHARAGSTWSPTWLSLTSSQSVQITPSKPSRSRSSPVRICRL